MVFDYLDKKQRIKIFLSVFIVFILFIIIVIFSLFLSSPPTNNRVIIQNLLSCTNDISELSKDTLQSSIYDLILEQNNINSLPSKDSYTATIREGSCTTGGNEENGFSTNIILDIESLNYSFEINYFWSSPKTKEFTQNAPIFYCLDDDQMIYDSFNCEKNAYIFQKIDPLVSLLPYFNENYEIKAIPSGSTKSGYAALLVYYPCFKDICPTKEELKKGAENYLETNGINLSDYIIYEKDYTINNY